MKVSAAERIRLWKEKTGKSERAYWRLKSLEQAGLPPGGAGG